ncbi:PDZ domain-containing protein [Chryseotalea sanaruensis]|uniref:PDZ domain-containing protein n=1 Tax=Chryseotalea sanaruensis TaxID=2482724 RepID=A0A401U7W4_9BACT|nr:Do family serine endopeptidase [Chryseotalea sanaruensis]GCC50984.1 PDZ domain-containing protein [Chryseotalea sanaruensis]
MKQFASIFFAAVLGSVFTIAAYRWLGNDDVSKTQYVNGTPITKVAYSFNENGEAVPLDFTTTAEKVTKAVVHIRSTQKQSTRENQQPFDPFREFFGTPSPQGRGSQPSQSTGSGVIINADGYIVTNNHVVKDADIVEVTLNDNRSFNAEVVGIDPDTDLAVLKVKETNLPFLAFVDSDQAKVGQWVLAVGNPFNLNSTVTAGIISAKGRNIGIVNREGITEKGSTAIESFIQTDAAINPGNSGGALVDLNGGLLGINTAIASPTGSYSGYGFAVPSGIVSKIVEDIIKFGVVQRGWLGVSVASVNKDLAKQYDLDIIEGAYVSGFAEKSAAKDAGIKEGDVVIKLDNTSIKSSTALTEYIGLKRPGDKVEVTVNRRGKEMKYTVTLIGRNGNTEIIKPEERSSLVALGIELEEIDTKVLKQLDLENGVRVKSLGNGKLARYTEMREGFIITRVNDTEVKSVKEFNEELKNKKAGDLVILSGTYDDFPREFNYAFRM